MTTSSDADILFIDIETFSGVDIRAAGLYPYIESDDFEVLLIAYAFGDDEVRVLDACDWSDELVRLIGAIASPRVTKCAHNNAFERTALGKHLGKYLPPEAWTDTMILAAMNGLPLSLDECGAALGIEQKKMREAAGLITYFCKPCKPTAANGGRKRNRPEHAPEKWETFKAYCKRDVEAMRHIYRRLAPVTTITDTERRIWCMDTRINERGVLVDMDFVRSAIAVDEAFREKHLRELAVLTGLDNPNSVSQLKSWLGGNGLTADSLSKAAVADLRASALDPTTKRVLELRALLGKTSTKKYETMTNAACRDHRVRGITQYYGAARTGRWAGRLVQLQNLPQNHLDGIEDVREIVKRGDLDEVAMLFDSVPDTLSQLIRTAFVAREGCTFLVADYSAIEARVIAYLADETWRQQVFAEGGDIYCASASRMFKVPVEKHGVNGHLRQKGKIAELALGYGGGVAALKAFGADKMGLTEEEMQEIVTSWRKASPSIPKMWRGVEETARRAICAPGRWQHFDGGVSDGRKRYRVCSYHFEGGVLRCRLPSGRELVYQDAMLDDGGGLTFMGQNQTTRKWERTETWGGKLVENIVQAFARDCLAESMLRLSDRGYEIVFHVHDEIIAEAPEGSRWEDMAAIMAEPISWAPGLLLRGDGYNTPFYKKD